MSLQTWSLIDPIIFPPVTSQAVGVDENCDYLKISQERAFFLSLFLQARELLVIALCQPGLCKGNSLIPVGLQG